MSLLELAWWAAAVQLLGGLFIASYIVKAIEVLLLRSDLNEARSRIAEGVVSGLGLMVAATLLKTLEARNWNQIAMIAVLMAMRIALKRHFNRRASVAISTPRFNG